MEELYHVAQIVQKVHTPLGQHCYAPYANQDHIHQQPNQPHV